jgi:hypothetical protein
MSPNVGRISSLAHDSRIRPHGTVSIELVHTIRLIVILALLALQTRVALRANTDSLSRLDECDFRSNAECCSNDLCFSYQLPTLALPFLPSIENEAPERRRTMPNTQREMLLPPPSRNSMQITRANPTSLDLDIDVVVTERLGLELVQLELSPVLRILDLEALERIWVNHFAFSSFQLPRICSNQIK